MLDQVGVSFSEGVLIIDVLSFLRVSEFYWNLDTGGKFALGNIVL
jgi:hypothetical protein